MLKLMLVSMFITDNLSIFLSFVKMGGGRPDVTSGRPSAKLDGNRLESMSRLFPLGYRPLVGGVGKAVGHDTYQPHVVFGVGMFCPILGRDRLGQVSRSFHNDSSNQKSRSKRLFVDSVFIEPKSKQTPLAVAE
jgi:hypothetical protein